MDLEHGFYRGTVRGSMYLDASRALEAVKNQHKQFLEFYNSELRLIGESIGGLQSLVAGEEDYTCLTSKKLLGKRDKSWGSGQ